MTERERIDILLDNLSFIRIATMTIDEPRIITRTTTYKSSISKGRNDDEYTLDVLFDSTPFISIFDPDTWIDVYVFILVRDILIAEREDSLFLVDAPIFTSVYINEIHQWKLAKLIIPPETTQDKRIITI